ncbi:putative endoglucanase precursor, partial [Basidiobolus meristosporus CBS 931.73]
LAVAHMEMVQPPPRHSRYNPTWSAEPDYNMVSPLSVYPCKGYGKGGVVQTVKAGDSVQVQISGSAPHGGGHCQFALSYDEGKTFAVLETIYSDCLFPSTNYSVGIPVSAGSSKNAIFAWAWINKIGNREYYMNCADLEIQGTDNGHVVGPKLLVANLPGYPTIPE